MNKLFRQRSGVLAAIAAAALIGAGPAVAGKKETASQAPAASYGGPMGYGMGPGMMGGRGGYGMGPGMMQGWGGHDMGPGMMQGWGMGGGMMGGMMGGCGMGPGMMQGWGGHGMGPGMMGGYAALGELDLSDEQIAGINRIQDETRKVHWAQMGTMMEHQARLRDLSLARQPDNEAIGKAYRDLGDLQQKMIESGLDARKRIDALLTKEQKEKLRAYQRRGW